MKYYIGADLGGTNIKVAVVDDEYNIRSKASCKTNMPRSAESIMDDIAGLCLEVAEKAGLSMDDISRIGIGTPGIVNPKTRTGVYSANLDFHNAPLGDLLEQRLHKPVSLENDANAAALGELLAGAGVGADSFVAITLGTGVGGGIIIDRKIVTGFNYYGAEIGHMVIEYNGSLCTCGRKGCFEAYSSATGLIRMTKKKMNESPDSLMHKIADEHGAVNGQTSFLAMKAGDRAGSEVVDEYIGYLACGIANVVNIFQPEFVCIGGGISHEGDTLLKPLQELVQTENFARDSGKLTKVVLAKLGNDAGIIGAAMAYDYQNI